MWLPYRYVPTDQTWWMMTIFVKFLFFNAVESAKLWCPGTQKRLKGLFHLLNRSLSWWAPPNAAWGHGWSAITCGFHGLGDKKKPLVWMVGKRETPAGEHHVGPPACSTTPLPTVWNWYSCHLLQWLSTTTVPLWAVRLERPWTACVAQQGHDHTGIFSSTASHSWCCRGCSNPFW